MAPDTLGEVRWEEPRVNSSHVFGHGCRLLAIPTLRVLRGVGPREETPVASYHDQRKALQAVAFLSDGMFRVWHNKGPVHWTRTSSILCWPYLEQALASREAVLSLGKGCWEVGFPSWPPFGESGGGGRRHFLLSRGRTPVWASVSVRVMTEVVSVPRVLAGER